MELTESDENGFVSKFCRCLDRSGFLFNNKIGYIYAEVCSCFTGNTLWRSMRKNCISERWVLVGYWLCFASVISIHWLESAPLCL